MTDSERPHLAQADLQFLRYLQKRVLIVELRDPHARRGASSTVVTVPSEDDGKLIIEGHITSTEAHDQTRVGSGRDSTLANNSNAGCSRGPVGVPRPSKGDVRR
jgi:hypothetical protein